MFFLTLEHKNRITAQAKQQFSLWSHTPANRNECEYQQPVFTSPANTSILCLSPRNPKINFVTLSRAASQPVALFPDIGVPLNHPF